MGQLQPYRAEKFRGGSGSYASQGVCSFCHNHSAKWMDVRGATWVAYCSECARFRRPCTCQVIAIEPTTGKRTLGGVDTCPMHSPEAHAPGREERYDNP